MENKHYVIVEGKKYSDYDLDDSDIPFLQEDKFLFIDETSKDEDSDEGEKNEEKNLTPVVSTKTVEKQWFFVQEPFSIQNKKLNIAIDLRKINTVKHLTDMLNEMHKNYSSNEDFNFSEFVNELNDYLIEHNHLKLSEIMDKDLDFQINWFDREHEKIELVKRSEF